MSLRDREILKSVKLSQTKVAKLFNITLQGVNRGITSNQHYLTPERLGKLIDLLRLTDPDTSELLKSKFYMVFNEQKESTYYGRTTSIIDILSSEDGKIIWIVTNPMSRLVDEPKLLHFTSKLLIITNNIKEISNIFTGDIFYNSEMLLFAPELLISKKNVYVNTIFGFQPINNDNIKTVRDNVYSYCISQNSKFFEELLA